MKKFLSVLLTCLMITAALTCCSSTKTNQDEKNNIKNINENGEIVIGAILPLTGTDSVYGTSAKQGFELAIEEINAYGGILGRKIVLNAKDDMNTPEKAVYAFNELVSESTTLIIGAVNSDCTFSISQMANKEKVILISPSATSDEIPSEDDYIFRTCYSDSAQGIFAAKFAKDLGYTEAAVLYSSDDKYSSSIYSSFKNACEEYGITVTVEEATDNIDTTDFTDSLSVITQSGIEFLFAPYYCDIAATYIIPQARQAGYDGIIMGTDVYAGCREYITNGSDLSAFENVMFTNHYDPASQNESAKAFVAAYKAKYGEIPSSYSALAYDTLFILASAIENAGTLQDNEAIKASLSATQNYKGVTGKFSLDQSGTPIKGAAIISYTVEDDKIVTKYVTDVTLL